MPKAIDITDKTFGSLTAIRPFSSDSGGIVWECRCACGGTALVRAALLNNGNTRSCGCGRRRHGLAGTRLYAIWRGMKSRCGSPRAHDYPAYGGRGIRVCAAWQDSFVSFRDWAMKAGYADILTIDRIDNDGDYEPENCRWVTSLENTRARGSNKLDMAAARDIRRRLSNARRGDAIKLAREVGVSPALVSLIRNGIIWTDEDRTSAGFPRVLPMVRT